MAFEFKIEKDIEIPEIVRGGGGRSLGFPFDKMSPGKGVGSKGDRIFVPRKFWSEEQELTDAHIDGAKGPGDLKDRIRRSFYGWRDKDADARDNLQLILVDQYDKESKKYAGVYVQLTLKDGAAAETPTEGNKTSKGAAKVNKKAA